MYYPLTLPEIGMYLEQKLHPSSAEYTLDFGLVINGAEEHEINSAMSEIFSRHAALRSYYSEDNGVPGRILSDEVPKILWREASSRVEVEHIISANDHAFSLSSIPVRVTGYKIPDGSVILHFTVHHIAFDGTSYTILIKELFSLLRGESLPSSQIDVTDFAQASHSEEYALGRKFYREMFSGGVPVNDMPLKAARPKIHPQHDSLKSYTFTEQELSSLTKSAHDLGATVFGLMFSAVSIAVGKYCGSEDIVMGFSVNTRPKEYSDVIGMFVNLAPVRLRPKADHEVSEYVRDVAGLIKSASTDGALPFSEVVREFSTYRDESRHPIFDVCMNYRHLPEKLDDGRICIEFLKTLRKLRHDLTVTIDRTDSGMTLFVQYSSELFDDGLIARFMEQIRETLRLIQERPEAKISDVSAAYRGNELLGGSDFGSSPDPDVQDANITGSGFLEIESRHADFGRISRFCSETGITEYAFFTGAYGYVLAGFTGEDGALFATVRNGRNDPRFSDSISMFAHTIPVLCRTADSNIRDYLTATDQQLRSSIAHASEITKELGITTDMLFAYQRAVSPHMIEKTML